MYTYSVYLLMLQGQCGEHIPTANVLYHGIEVFPPGGTTGGDHDPDRQGVGEPWNHITLRWEK